MQSEKQTNKKHSSWQNGKPIKFGLFSKNLCFNVNFEILQIFQVDLDANVTISNFACKVHQRNTGKILVFVKF